MSLDQDDLWNGSLAHVHFVYAPSQWDTMSHCNVVTHWLGAHTKWSLPVVNLPGHMWRGRRLATLNCGEIVTDPAAVHLSFHHILLTMTLAQQSMTHPRSLCTTLTTSRLLVISGVSDLWKAVGILIGSLNLQWIPAYTESTAAAVILQCIFTHDDPNQLQVIFHNLLTVTQPPGWDCVTVYSNPGNYFGFIPLSVPKHHKNKC